MIVVVVLAGGAGAVLAVPGGNDNLLVREAKAVLGKLKNYAAKAKMVLANWQITLTISFNCSPMEFPALFERALSSLTVVNLDITPSLGLQCVWSTFDYASKMVFVAVGPILFVLLLLVFFLISKGCSARDADRDRTRVACYTYTFLLWTFIVVVSVFDACTINIHYLVVQY